jgi:hypothetical protein
VAVSLNPRLRLRFVRTIVTTLFLSLFATFPAVSPLQSASASTTITKTVTIKGSTDALYSGAQVSVIYFTDGDSQETKKDIQTTNSNGQVTISYPINASYAQMFITPPSSDTTHAVHTVDLLTSTDAAISNVKLKVSNLRIKTTLPSGGDSGQYTCVDYPKVPSSRWVTTQYRTTRAGAFGLAIPTTLNTIRDYHIVVSPCNSSDYNYLAKNYGLRMASNKAITLFSDDTFKSTLTASSNVYSLAFDQGKVRGQILDSNGSPFTIPTATYIYLSATPLASDGSVDENRDQVWSWQSTPDNKFSFESGFQEGRYKISVYSYGENPITNFEAGDIWVDSSLKYSTTSGGTYTTSLDLTYNSPNTGLTKFKFVDVMISIDGVKEINDYIRYPSDWGTIEQNLKKYDNTPAMIDVKILCTVQILNVFFLPEFINWLSIQKFKKISQTNLDGTFHPGILQFPQYLCIKSLPKEFKNKVSEKIFRFAESNTDNPSIQRMLKIISFMNAEDWSNQFNQTLEYLEKMDQLRNTDSSFFRNITNA